MSSNSHDWSALASHNERVVTPSALQTGLNPRPAGAAGQPGPPVISRGGSGCGSGLFGQVPPHARDRLIDRHPLLLAGQPGGELDHPVG